MSEIETRAAFWEARAAEAQTRATAAHTAWLEAQAAEFHARFLWAEARRLAAQAQTRARKASLAGFQEFWAAYPRKVGKGQAETTWRKLKLGPLLLPVLLAGIERAKQDPQWLRDDGRYIPHPSTWLNARGWEDEPTRYAHWVAEAEIYQDA